MSFAHVPCICWKQRRKHTCIFQLLLTSLVWGKIQNGSGSSLPASGGGRVSVTSVSVEFTLGQCCLPSPGLWLEKLYPFYTSPDPWGRGVLILHYSGIAKWFNWNPCQIVCQMGRLSPAGPNHEAGLWGWLKSSTRNICARLSATRPRAPIHIPALWDPTPLSPCQLPTCSPTSTHSASSCHSASQQVAGRQRTSFKNTSLLVPVLLKVEGLRVC